VALPNRRRLAVLLAFALLLVAVAATAAVRAEPSRYAGHAYALGADANAAPRAGGLARAAATYRGGPITTSTGEIVDVRVSDALPLETVTPEAWAEFIAGLTHGPEIAQLTAYIVTFDELQEICGQQALGCYARDQLVAPGEAAFDTTPEEIVRHEYGHHVAYHRSNSPWSAIEWGPKRWASAADVCVRVGRSEAFPGNEGSNYARNPGEAWAEVYRLMDERKAGITTATWPIISPSFFPDEADLTAAEQDVVQPWTASHTTSFVRVFGKRTARVWWIPLATPLDGDLRLSATLPARGAVDVSLVAPNRRTVVRRAQWTGQRVKRIETSVCGQRSLFVRVVMPQGTVGRVRLSVTTA
jgi:hypothetical protein